MTISRSSSSWLVVLATLALLASSAHAGRKRLVVLDFDGPKAEKFHEDVVKLLKKSNTVISADKWNSAAEELGADAITEKNVKKVAKKLKLDGVVTGKVEKRRDEYIVRIKLRAGTSGALTGNSVQTKSGSPRLDGQAQRDLKDELIPAIDALEANHGGGGGDDEASDEEKPTKKKKVADEEEEAPAPKKSGFSKKKAVEEEEDEPPAKKKMAKEEDDPPPTKKEDKKKKKDEDKKKKDDEAKKKKADEEDKADEKAALATKKDKEEDESPLPKKRGSDEEDTKKKTASSEEEGDGDKDKVEEEAPAATGDKALAVSPGRRAIDAVVGLSFVRRNLSFTYAADLGKPPPGYKQTIPVAGAMADITFFPLSFNHKPKGILGGLGFNVLYDRVLIINSQKRYADASGMQATANLKTEESRWGIGAVLRYPLGSGAKAPVVGGRLTYGSQSFTVQQTLPNNEKTDIPNIKYSMISPGAFLQYPVNAKIIFNAGAAFHAVMNTGPIQGSDQYGSATVLGFEFGAGIDYMLKTNIFIRGGIRFETFGFTFKGDPMSMTNTRDTDPEQDVMGAKDTYIGGAATVGYLY